MFDQINIVTCPVIKIFSFTLYFLNKSILISKVTTIPILISSNPIAIWGDLGNDERLSNINFEKKHHLKYGKSRKWYWYYIMQLEIQILKTRKRTCSNYEKT